MRPSSTTPCSPLELRTTTPESTQPRMCRNQDPGARSTTCLARAPGNRSSIPQWSRAVRRERLASSSAAELADDRETEATGARHRSRRRFGRLRRFGRRSRDTSRCVHPPPDDGHSSARSDLVDDSQPKRRIRTGAGKVQAGWPWIARGFDEVGGSGYATSTEHVHGVQHRVFRRLGGHLRDRCGASQEHRPYRCTALRRLDSGLVVGHDRQVCLPATKVSTPLDVTA